MSDKKYLLPRVNQYFRANLHTHSKISDGTLTPEELKEHYKSRGYSILAITDHMVIADHSHLTDDDFLMLTGAEYNTEECDGWGEKHLWIKTYHLNFIAKRPDNLWQPFGYIHPKERMIPYMEKADIHNLSHEYDCKDLNAIIKEAHKRGFLVSYNHPTWSLQDYTDYADLEGLWGVEISNSIYRVGFGDFNNSRVYSDLLNKGNRLFPVGADDTHSPRDMGYAWVMVGAEKLDYPSVIDALEKGDFYASTGPEIYELSIENGNLHVRCSDAQFITVESGTRFAQRVNPTAPDKLLRQATFDLTKWLDVCTGESTRDWIRVTVYDANGSYAATRAYFPEELK